MAPPGWILLFFAAGLAAVAHGCRPAAESPLVLEFWAMGREGEAAAELVPGFEARWPDTRVRVQQIPWSAAHEKLVTAFVGGAMPDVFQVGNTWVSEFAALGAVEPLDALLPPGAARADFFPGILEANVVEGRLFAVPWYVDTRLLFYRADLLARAGRSEAPRSWTEWVAALDAVKRLAGSEGYAVLLPLNEWQTPVILAMQRGATLLREDDGRGDFSSPAFHAAFEFYLDLFRRGFAPRGGAAEAAGLYQGFAEGFFAFFVSGPWNLGELRKRLPAALAGAWTTAAMPAPDGDYPGLSLAGGSSLAVFRLSPRQEAARRWVQYLAEPPQQVAFHRLTGDLPARPSAWLAAALADDARASAFLIQLRRVRATPRIPEWERIAAKIAEHAEAAIRGLESTDEALARLDADVDRILEKRRWLRARADASAGGEAATPGGVAR